MNDRGAFFSLGGPDPLDDAPRNVPAGPAGPAARFRFRFGPEAGWLFPVPILEDTLTAPVSDAGRWAVGDVVMLDDDRCEAAFALLTADARDHAEERLRRWAKADDWELMIVGGLRALRPPEPARWSTTYCESCGRDGHRAAVTMPYTRLVSFLSTRCPDCGGRYLPVRTVDAPAT